MTKKNEAVTVTLEAGDRISHGLFGEGIVKGLARSQNGKDIHVHVEFDEPYQRSENLPSTRFRKILSTYLEKLEWNDVVENDDTVDVIKVAGLEESGLVQFSFSEEEEEYKPTNEEEQEVASEDDMSSGEKENTQKI